MALSGKILSFSDIFKALIRLFSLNLGPKMAILGLISAKLS